MQIYILRDNQQTGPFTEAEVRAQLAAGTLAPDTMVWWDGLPEWQPVSQTPLASAPTIPLSSPSSTFASPITAGDRMGTRTSGLAIGSLISGLFGLLCWPILGPAAVIMGHISRSQIRKNPLTLTGAGIALAGMILGYFEIALFIGYILLLAIAGPKLQQQIMKMQQQLQQQAQDQQKQMQQQQSQNTNSPAMTPPASAPDSQPATSPPTAPVNGPTAPPSSNPPATPESTPPPPPANPPATPSNP